MRIVVVIGTRPEAIKLAPVIRNLADRPDADVRICLSGQHRELLSQGLADFSIEPHYDLDVMECGQSVNSVVVRVMERLAPVLEAERPDWLVVQGDTSTAMASALTAFHCGVRVAHVEAGLRTGDPAQPWPEEINRRLVAQLADLHFAPTEGARENLLREGVARSRIVVCGNTVIDALMLARRMWDGNNGSSFPIEGIDETRPLILFTLHRRENLSHARLAQVEAALWRLVEDMGCQVVFPHHPNPALSETVDRLRHHHADMKVVAPLNYVPFVGLMQRATMILTDSGGIQEEAAFLGKPVLILRDRTERPEVLSGCGLLVGTDTQAIVHAVNRVLSEPTLLRYPAGALAGFGDGGAAAAIVEHLFA